MRQRVLGKAASEEDIARLSAWYQDMLACVCAFIKDRTTEQTYPNGTRTAQIRAQTACVHSHAVSGVMFILKDQSNKPISADGRGGEAARLAGAPGLGVSTPGAPWTDPDITHEGRRYRIATAFYSREHVSLSAYRTNVGVK